MSLYPMQIRLYGASVALWGGSGIGIHCPTRHTAAVQVNSYGWLDRRASKSPSRLVQPKRVFGVYAAGNGDGVHEEYVWAHDKRAEEMAQMIAFKTENGLKLSNDEMWYNTLDALKDHIQVHGRLPSSNVDLGKWINKQRVQYKKWLRKEDSYITPERIAALERIPEWDWFPYETAWNAKLEELKQYVKEHGQLPLIRHSSLGMWIDAQRADYKASIAGKRSPMRDKRINDLESVPGWDWFPFETVWNAKLQELKQYVEEHGEMPVGRHSTLDTWITHQRRDYTKMMEGRQSAMTDKRIKDLESVPGWEWVPYETVWNAKLQELKQYVKEHGQLPLLKHSSLGSWIDVQRKEYTKSMAGKASSMTVDRIAELEAVHGWVWEVDMEARYQAGWTAELEQLREHISAHGRLPSTTHPTVGLWIKNLRQQYKKGELSRVRIAALESIPQWKWKGRTAKKQQQDTN